MSRNQTGREEKERTATTYNDEKQQQFEYIAHQHISGISRLPEGKKEVL